MKKMIIILFLCLTTVILTAPPSGSLIIFEAESIKPYEKIWKAVCKIESSGNPLAYHMEDNGFASIGIVQIQGSRINDFKAISGINYSLMDMYSPDKAKRVFMWYASEINPNNPEMISRLWNGGPSGMSKKSTIKYWKLIQKVL